MSRWTDFRDDVKNLAEDHPKKVAFVFVVGVFVGAFISWVV